MAVRRTRSAALTLGALAITLLTACSLGGTAAPASSTSSPEASVASSSAPSAAAAEPSETRAGAAPGSSQVEAAVEAFYGRYAADPTAPDTRAYLTPAAASTVFAPGDADRVLCAQNTPSSMTFGAPVLSSGEATVVVTTHWTGSPDRHITVTVALPDMLISAITCPAS